MEGAIKEIFNTSGMNLWNKICYYLWIILFCLLLITQVIFFGLKLTGLVSWNWGYIFIPFFGILALFVVGFVCIIIDLIKYS